ncbi:MCP four helix bundle domain-containing protein [Haloferula sp. BvORR071]|uniref:MCP four helix bundle domain-containing protein n=1 Tax=Haloferula sp. BvORR071 TaxID=1396141 RepID=UPI002240F769|nr:MCP four helix bundle domain-containing protein [Haloferula sp. BvORR071]
MKPGPLRSLSLAATVVILLAIVTSPVLTVWMIRKEASRIVTDPLQGLASSSLATMQASEGFLETARAVDGNGMPGAELGAWLEASSAKVDAQYASYQQTAMNEQERSVFERLNACKTDYRATRKTVVGLLSENKTTEATLLFESQCVPKFHAYAGALGELVKHNAEEAKSGGAQIIRLCHILLGVQGLLLVFFFIYGFFVPLTAVLERLTRKPIVIRN